MPVLSLLVALLAVADPAGTPSAGRLDALLARPPLTGVAVSVAALDVESGRMVHAVAADRPMVPASNMKLLTTAAAVALLGADHRFETTFLAAAPPDASGVVSGDLVARGGGDPCLRSDVLGAVGVADPAGQLADLLVEAGVRRVTGRLLVDDGLFTGSPVHPDWPAEDLGHEYAAPVQALSIEGNCLVLSVAGRGSGPSARLVTEARGYRVVNSLQRSADPADLNVWATRPDEEGVVRVLGSVGGRVGERSLRVPVRDGARLFGACLLSALERRGVVVERGLEHAPGAAAALTDPHTLAVLTTPLSTAVLLANKESDNSIADHLFKLVGAARAGEGSFEGGAAALNHFLVEWVGSDTGALVLRDGSGLSPRNRLSARALAETLRAMARSDGAGRDLYLRSLPVAGMDGSLRSRLTDEPYRGAVRAKTGFIGGASSLSGYAHTRSGRTVAFAILFNEVPPGKNHQMKAIQDDVCRYLVDAL